MDTFNWERKGYADKDAQSLVGFGIKHAFGSGSLIDGGNLDLNKTPPVVVGKTNTGGEAGRIDSIAQNRANAVGLRYGEYNNRVQATAIDVRSGNDDYYIAMGVCGVVLFLWLVFKRRTVI